jgi:flagellar protein FlaG
VAGVFTSSVGRLSEAIDDRGVQISDSVRTDIEVISDNGTGACVYNCEGNGNLTLLVKNTGTETLPARGDLVSVIVDGEFQTASNVGVTVLGDAERWRPSDVVRIEVSGLGLTKGSPLDDHRAKITINGDEEIFQFRY